jgi:hypothetical protein
MWNVLLVFSWALLCLGLFLRSQAKAREPLRKGRR